jgi:hypothetical protein
MHVLRFLIRSLIVKPIEWRGPKRFVAEQILVRARSKVFTERLEANEKATRQLGGLLFKGE